MAKKKKEPLKIVTYVKRSDGSGYDLFNDLPDERKREIATNMNKRVIEICAESLGYKVTFE